ncbi:MAG TPA: type II secretion system F family protein [Candidatus Paceibacterota bacterium]|nr:type II secretion system F family protein [Candidatus Paceibacterota bacterium]
MEYSYEALDQNGKPIAGKVTAATEDAAIESLQRRGFIVTAFSAGGPKGLVGQLNNVSFFNGASSREVVLLSRQIATLFEAQVSALRIFKLLAEQAQKPFLRGVLSEISDDLQNGSSISNALAKHPKVFSNFYINMVRSGEESGKLDETFLYLADYIDRSYELSSKARNALVYPGFILLTFLGVMILMLTVVIPKIGQIISDSGQQLPFITQVVLGISTFFIDYGIFLLVAIIIGGFFIYRFAQTPGGRIAVSRFELSLPVVGALYQKLFLSRIADNMHVMLSSGISAVRALEITGSVVGNSVYEQILKDATDGVKAGTPMSQTFAKHAGDIPPIMIQMLQIGEETGEVGNILDRLAKFYNREVNAAVDTLVSLIEPVLIISLALGVGFLLASVLLPIYNTAGTI